MTEINETTLEKLDDKMFFEIKDKKWTNTEDYLFGKFGLIFQNDEPIDEKTTLTEKSKEKIRRIEKVYNSIKEYVKSDIINKNFPEDNFFDDDIIEAFDKKIVLGSRARRETILRMWETSGLITRKGKWQNDYSVKSYKFKEYNFIPFEFWKIKNLIK